MQTKQRRMKPLGVRATLGRVALLATSLAIFSMLHAGAGAAETLRIAGNFPVKHSSSIAMKKFAESVAKLTNGKLKIETFPAMQLGGAKENVDQVSSGAIFGTWIGVAYLSRIVPQLEAISLPFVYPDQKTAFRVLDGKVGRVLNEKLAKKGFEALGWMELGFRNVTNNVRPIKSVADFKGLKIRLQPDKTQIATFRAIGADPVPMDISEVYSALQQGVLDGEENPYSIILTNHFNEVQKYLSNSGQFFDFIVFVVNKRKFDKLSKAYKTAIRAAAAKAVAWQRQRASAENAAARKKLIASGMIYTPLSLKTKMELQQRTKGVVQTLKKRIGPDLIDLVLREAKSK